MTTVRAILLALLAALSLGYLFTYGSAVAAFCSCTRCGPSLYALDEPSFYLYRDSGHGPLRLPPALFLVGPHKGPGIILRIPGWIPALPALAVFGCVVVSICQPHERSPA
jgi:hypothetical protein